MIPAIIVPGSAPCPSGNLHSLTSIVPWPFLARRRQDWGPEEVHSFPPDLKHPAPHTPRLRPGKL